MTVPPFPPGAPTPDDVPHGDVSLGPVELASALVDGLPIGGPATADGTNPQVTALAAQFTALRQHLGQALDVDDDLREAHLASALEAFDALGLAPHHSDAAVIPLEAARQRRARRLAPVFAAAAAVAAIGLVVGLAANHNSGNDSLSLDATVVQATSNAQAKSAPPIPEVAETAAVAPAAEANAASDTGRAVSIAAATVDTAGGGDAEGSGDIGSSTEPTNGSDPTYVANVPAQLAPIAQSILRAHRTDGRPLPVTPCDAKTAGVAIARLMWEQHAALLFVTPGIEQPANAVVVNAASCVTEISVALGG